MQKVKLGDVCEILDNQRVPITASERKAGPYPYYGANGLQDYVDGYIFDDDLVLLAEDGGNFGSKDKPIAYRVSGKCWVNNHAHVLKPKDNIDVNYLCYSLMFYNVDGLVNGATRQKLTQKDMRKISIPLPLIEEQKAIAEKLDKVSILIEKRKQQFSLLDTLVKSKFVEMFGDFDLRHTQSNWLQIGKMATVVGGSTPKTENAKYWGGDYCWITPAELENDSFIVKNTVRKITKAGVDSCSLKKLPVGTVLLSSRAPIGKVAIAGIEMYCNQGFKNLICSKFLNSIYAYYLLKFNVEYLNSLGRGATFKEISKTIVENILIPVPTIDLQNQYSNFVKQTEKLKEKIKQSLAALELLKKSLMQKYFGG